MPHDIPWNEATSRLVKAVEAHDLTAARRALMQGALIAAVRTVPGDPMPQGPMYQVLLGHASPDAQQWLIDVPMVHLLLTHAAPLQLSTGSSLLGLVSASQAANAHEVVPLLAAAGDRVTTSILMGRLITPAPVLPLPNCAQVDVAVMLDVLWQHASPQVHAEVQENGLKTLLQHSNQGRLTEHGLKMTHWLIAHGVNAHKDLPLPGQSPRLGQLHPDDWARVQAGPEALPPLDPLGNVVPFRRPRPR